MTTPRLLALAALCCGALAASAPSPASNLLTEYLGADEAILINSLAPRFSWLVASAARGVGGPGPAWNSRAGPERTTTLGGGAA